MNMKWKEFTVTKCRPAIYALLLNFSFAAGYAQSNYREESEKIFARNAVAIIQVDLAQEHLDYVLDIANAESDSLFPARLIFKNDVIAGDTLEPVGFRLRGNTSRYAQKKSFKLDLNEYVRGQKLYGLEKLNVNGEHNDPAIMRSRLCWDLFNQSGVPAARTAYAALYINGQYYGLYVIVEHYDENFILDRFGNNDGNFYKCLYPAPLTWLGPDQDAYKQMRNSRDRAYELEINEEIDDYSDLVSFIGFLNNTSDADFARAIEERFNVRAFLKYLAVNTLLGSWDDYWYLQNNYYLYHNTVSGKFEFIPYDYDNTYGIDFVGGDWGTRDIYDFGHPSEPRPLVTRLLNIPAYRNLYSFYLKEALNGSFTLAAHESKFNHAIMVFLIRIGSKRLTLPGAGMWNTVSGRSFKPGVPARCSNYKKGRCLRKSSQSNGVRKIPPPARMFSSHARLMITAPPRRALICCTASAAGPACWPRCMTMACIWTAARKTVCGPAGFSGKRRTNPWSFICACKARRARGRFTPIPRRFKRSFSCRPTRSQRFHW
ncbi:hypothetical protein DCC62_17635 [candidate division KSB1 bacterium]|nr:MAG: hypothetical protein DCC62_17635 [candidate division KSB1 bacterium]